jgi:predicted HicB family RNase H-like nuclease
MKRKKSKFTTRLPFELNEWLKDYADKNGNSANEQITKILEKEKALSAVTPKASDVNTTNS